GGRHKAERRPKHHHGRRLAAAVKWYEIGLISQAKAAELAGISRERFLASLARFEASPFQETPEDLARESELE
ncbi:UPF0175 family protein, partial [Thermodesulfobacteriota bacterium]